MNKKTLWIKRKDRQQGISLVVSLIMLLIMTVIGISAMNTSISKLKMTTGIQQQSFVSNSTEESLLSGEETVDLADTDASISGHSGFFTTAVNLSDKDMWANNAFDGVNGDSKYIIEYLGAVESGNDTATEGGVPGIKDIYHVYRITARSVNNNGTTRMFQSVYISENAPASGGASSP